MIKFFKSYSEISESFIDETKNFGFWKNFVDVTVFLQNHLVFYHNVLVRPNKENWFPTWSDFFVQFWKHCVSNHRDGKFLSNIVSRICIIILYNAIFHFPQLSNTTWKHRNPASRRYFRYSPHSRKQLRSIFPHSLERL